MSCQEHVDTRNLTSADSQQVADSGISDSTEEHTSDIFIYMTVTLRLLLAKNFVNGHTDSHCSLDQNSHFKQMEKHLKKTRTCLLLLAILAVSLTYQSGLNPPGGFWSGSVNNSTGDQAHGSGSVKNHTAGDRILEDNDHARFIAFFYLDPAAFVASLVMILMLLNKSVIEKLCHKQKRLALPPLCHELKINITCDKEMDRRRNLLLTLAILAATVTY
ncbi:hypothetical protein EJB05_45084, partial [Eragrostis curvula]